MRKFNWKGYAYNKKGESLSCFSPSFNGSYAEAHEWINNWMEKYFKEYYSVITIKIKYER